MLRKFVIFILIVAVVGGAAFWVLSIPQTVPASELPVHTPDLANGKTMYLAGGCSSCHAVPRQDDRMRLGGGLGLKTPFGIFYVPNISPDRNDGIGAWNEADFVTAMVKGTSPDGRHFFPAFPYTSYQRMNYADVRDLFAYLKTLPPVQGKVRDHDVRFPFNVRRLVGGWKFLFVDGKSFEPDATKSAQWNRGAYLVSGPGHCAECHSSRNLLGAVESHLRFAGGPDFEEGGWIPNIRGKKMTEWSEKDMAYLLRTGMTPDGDSVGSSMTFVIRNTSQLSDEDLAAMAVYLKSLPIVEGAPRPEKK